jgi:DNA-binding transcriptional MerR regulator
VADFDITELCERASVTPRTVHFYVQQGLLPPAGSPGPGARYSQGHVSRIRLIRLLQKQHLPLAEIAKRIKGITDEQVDALVAETKQRRAEGKGSARDYIRSVLAESKAPGVDTARPAARALMRHSTADSASIAPQASPEMLRARTAATTSTPAPTRSQWERHTLADGMELHIRRPLSRIEQKQFEKLMAAAREVFDDNEGET